MNAFDALLARAQPGYEVGVQAAVSSLQGSFGPGRLDHVQEDQLAEALTLLLEQGPVSAADSQSAVIIRDLQVLEWWCGLAMSDEVKARLARVLRRDYRLQIEAAGLKRPKPDVAARRCHVVFVGTLGSPLHSPSVAAVGYLRALASDVKTRRIDVYHYGPIDPNLAVEMEAQLPSTPTIRFHQIEEHPDFLVKAVLSAPCTYHFWCYPRMNIDYSFMALFGPTVMFTCADDPPMQYADVFWSAQTPEHVARLWASAPDGFRENYVRCQGGNFRLKPPVNLRTKRDLGLTDGDLLLATVGNRLSVDLDEPFVTGVEKALRARPSCHWLVVGALPEGLLGAMRTVLGRQFHHIRLEPDLAGLMPAADLWLNPFRRGGGHSAVIASVAGAPVLTRGDLGDVASCVPAEHWTADAADYFVTLDRLLDNAEERAEWRAAQQAFMAAWLDPALYVSEIDRLVSIAFERFRARARAPLDLIFPDAKAAAAA